MVYKDAKMAELAAYLYIASHSVLYQTTFYSENTFLMFTLIGFYALYSGPLSSSSGTEHRDFAIPRNSSALLACFFFGMSTLTRSTGVLLSLFIAFFVGNKFLIIWNKPLPACKAVATALLCIAVMFAPLIIVVYWKPTELHCGLREDRQWQGEMPTWCSDKVPSVYTYIQLKYWENRFLGFLYRGPENFLTAIPMNIIYSAVTLRLAISRPGAFFSLGIFGKS